MRLARVQRLEGRLQLPGDKSISHRAALIAALASGRSRIHNFSTAIDCASTLSCLEQLGIEIERSGSQVSIDGRKNFSKPDRPLDCGNSGSTMRILAGVLANQNFTSQLTGDSSLNSRPMKRIIDPLELMGAAISSIDGKPPLTIDGSTNLKPIAYKLPVASAQVKSAILFAALGTEGRTQVIESSLSRDHTERLFNGFGVSVSTSEDLTVTIDGPAQLVGGDITIPGDISSAAYFIAAAMLLHGSNLVIDAVGLNPTRAEYLSVFRCWGANISMEDIHSERNEPVGTVVIDGGLRSATITETERRINGAQIPAVIDELPLLAVVGSQIPGGIEIRDAGELRHKESDRLKATAINLRKMGVEVEEYDDGLFVNGPTKFHGASLDSFGDHRIAMAFSIAALLADGPTEIAGAECVDISFPEFFKLLHSLMIA
jgi:3-phosphoshikimate 1-carboxyvinyltransferase